MCICLKADTDIDSRVDIILCQWLSEWSFLYSPYTLYSIGMYLLRSWPYEAWEFQGRFWIAESNGNLTWRCDSSPVTGLCRVIGEQYLHQQFRLAWVFAQVCSVRPYVNSLCSWTVAALTLPIQDVSAGHWETGTCIPLCAVHLCVAASSVGQGTRTGRPARLTSSSCVDAYKQKPLQSSVDSRASGKGSLRVEWRKVCKKVPEEERERDPPKEMWADKRQTSSAKTSMETSPNNNQSHRKAIIDHPSIPEVPIFSAHRTNAISTTDEKDQGIDHFYPKTQLSAAHQGFRVRNQPRPFKTGLRPRQLPGHSYQAPEKALPSVQVQAFRRPKKPSITSGFTPPVVSHVPEPVFVDVSGLRAPHSSPRISKAPTKSALHSFRS